MTFCVSRVFLRASVRYVRARGYWKGKKKEKRKRKRRDRANNGVCDLSSPTHGYFDLCVGNIDRGKNICHHVCSLLWTFDLWLSVVYRPLASYLLNEFNRDTDLQIRPPSGSIDTTVYLTCMPSALHPSPRPIAFSRFTRHLALPFFHSSTEWSSLTRNCPSTMSISRCPGRTAISRCML